MSKRIDVQDLKVTYVSRDEAFTALDGISFSIDPGEFVSVVGASGCGKSTLLAVLEGLLAPTSGSVRVDGVPVTGPGPERSVVFQQYSLFPWMTARGNVEFALAQAKPGLGRRERRALAEEYLAKVGLAGFGHRYPKELSGGQQQRVAIARALAEDGEVLLMDEPFGAIDASNRAILQDLLLDLWEGEPGSERKTVVFVTHDLEEAILLSDRIIVMEPGHIRAEEVVPLPRPRHRLELLQDGEYVRFRGRLAQIFFAKDYRKERAA